MQNGSSGGKPSIVFVALQTGAGANGGIASLGEIMCALTRYRAILITNLDSPSVAQWRSAGIEVLIVREEASLGLRRAPWRTILTYVRFFRALRHVLSQSGAKVVHANDPLAFQLCYAATRSFRGRTIALNIRDTLEPCRKAPTARYGWMFGHADHVFFLSDDMRDRWIDIIPEAARASSATRSIVDFTRFHYAPIAEEMPPKIILLSGVVSAKKGQLRFLEKVAPILAANDIQIWLSGDYAPDADAYAFACRRAAANLGDAVRFLAYRSDLPQLLKNVRMVCVSSTHEGLMRTMIEAMAVGRAVISTDVSSAREMLEKPGREAGIVFPVAFDSTMGEAILRLCNDENRLSEMGRHGAKIARELFSRATVVASYEDVYDQLLQTT